MADEVKAPGIDLPDSLIDRYLSGEGEDTGAPDEEESTTADEIDAEDSETEGQLDDSEDGDTEDEVGEEGEEEDSEEPGNEDEEDEESEESETEDEAEEDPDTFLSEENLKKHQKEIQKDPHLNAIYKSMQRDYTRKTTEVARIRDEVEQANAEYEYFEQTLQDVAEGGGRETFLLEAALASPEVFQRAFDRAVELLEDPDARKKYEREREVEERERQLSEREKADIGRAKAARVEEIHLSAEDYALKFGIKDGAGLTVAKKYVAKVILENQRFQKHQDVFVTEEQIRDAVKEAALDIRANGSPAPAGGRRKGKVASPEQVREIAKKSRPRVVPGNRSPSSSSTLKPLKDLPKGVDPLDARIDQVLSG
jgi:hypothetical protein